MLAGIVLSVKRQAEKKIEKERQQREACEQELGKFRSYCTSLEGEIDYLHRLLKQHGIEYTEKVQKRPVSSQISVEVELNHRVAESGGGSGSGSGSSATGNGAAAMLEEGGGGREARSGVMVVDGQDNPDIVTLESSVTLA